MVLMMFKQTFVHTIHICCFFFCLTDIQKGRTQTEGVNFTSYDINALFEGHCDINTGLFQAKYVLFT